MSEVLTRTSDLEDAAILGLAHIEVVYHVVSCLVCAMTYVVFLQLMRV